MGDLGRWPEETSDEASAALHDRDGEMPCFPHCHYRFRPSSETRRNGGKVKGVRVQPQLSISHPCDHSQVNPCLCFFGAKWENNEVTGIECMQKHLLPSTSAINTGFLLGSRG